MSLKIRLNRCGSKNNPKYKIVLTESHYPRDGKFIELIGHFDPINSDKIYINIERCKYWILKGAKPTLRVKNLIKNNKN